MDYIWCNCYDDGIKDSWLIMLLSALIGIFTAVVTTLLSVLPNMTSMPQGFTDAWEWVVNFVAMLAWTIPGGEQLLLIFNLLLSAITAYWIYKSINWVINKLRGSGN